LKTLKSLSGTGSADCNLILHGELYYADPYTTVTTLPNKNGKNYKNWFHFLFVVKNTTALKQE